MGATVVLGLLVGLTPGFRGLYFVPQQMPVVLIACVLAGCVWALRGQADGRLFRLPVDWAALALAGAYLLAMFVAVQPEGAVLSWLGRCLYFLVFWCAGEVALRWRAGRMILAHGVLLGGATVALTGILGAAGLFAAHSWYVGGRMYTSVQYPDAAAAYVAATFFIAQGLRTASDVPWRRVAYGLLSATYLMVFVWALSRGASIVFVPALILFVIALGRSRLIDGVAGVVIAAAAFAASARPYEHVLKAADAAGKAPGLHATLESVALLWAAALLLGVLWEALRTLPDRARTGATAGAGVLALAAAAVAVLKFHLVSAVGSHFAQFNFQTYDAWSRIRWSEDAFRMFLHRPILGWGGGGWAAAYRAFQSYDYSSTQVHDAWMQTAVATGVIGFACWVALWVLVFWSAAVAWKRVPPERRPEVGGLAAGVLMLAGHGMLDFTLSLWSISMGLWTIAGLLRGECVDALAPAPEPGRRRWAQAPAAGSGGLWQGAAFYTGIVAVAVVALVELSGVRQVAAAAQLVNQPGQIDAGITALQTVARGTPWSAGAYVDLAQAEAAKANQDLAQTSAAQQAQAQSDAQAQEIAANADYAHAIALDAYNASYHTAYGRFLEATGQTAAAITQYRTAVKDAPFDVTTYETLSNGLVNAAANALGAKDTGGARSWLQAIPPLAAQIQARYAAIPGLVRAAGETTFPQTDDAVQLAIGEADTILGDYSTAATVLTPVAKSGAGGNDRLAAEVYLWLGEAEQKGQAPGAAADLQKAQQLFGSIKNPTAGETYAAQKSIADPLVGAAKP